MPLNYANLDSRTRTFMVEEIDMDLANGTLYLSAWFTAQGRQDWPALMRDAASTGDDASLAAQISLHGRLLLSAQRRRPTGGYVTYRVPYTAPETISEGEFNRFYARGLCRRAVDERISSLIVYRGKAVANPRPLSVQKVGTAVDPSLLLTDLRTSIGVDPALGIPAGPNSGLTVRLPP
jgi:hypothetical protein